MTRIVAPLVALAALAGPLAAQTYRADDQALAFFDTMCCQAGDTPVDQHVPEIGQQWNVEGATNDAQKPKVTSSRLNFEPQSPAVAVGAGPTGERTMRAVVWEPNGHPADVTLTLIERYQDRLNFAALRLRWPTTGAELEVDAIAVTNGAVSFLVGLGSLDVAGYDRHVPVEIASVPNGSQGGHDWTVHVDGQLLPSLRVPGFDGVAAFAVAAEAPVHPHPDGYYARVEDVVVLEPATPVAVVCDGMRGWNAESCIRDGHGPERTFGYGEARDHLFETVWVESQTGPTPSDGRRVAGVYGGLVGSWTYASPLSPRDQMQSNSFNTEHVWPRSRGAQTGPSTDGAPHNDLHHLAPAYDAFNSTRSNRAYGDDFDQPNDTQKWLRNNTTRYNSSGPPTDPAEWSRVEYDFLNSPDNGDGYKDLSELGRFDVRHDWRGDVARMAAYFLVTYRIEAEDGDEGRDFIELTLETLLDWHEQDPVDAFEIERNERVYRIQGNRNPFVLDPTLLRRTFYQGPNAPRSREVWINEVHHTNSGADRLEGVELAGRAGTDAYGYRVWVYSGYGFMYQVDGNGADGTPAVVFRGTIDDEGGGIGAIWAGAERLRGGCQGLALTDPDGELLQFLSYGGCMFNATEGAVYEWAEAQVRGAGSPAHPDSLVWSTGIKGARPAPGRPHRRVQEWSQLPPGYSLQLTGAGDAYEDFTWAGPLPETRGRLNDYQAPGLRLANGVSGWASGDDAPLGLLAPAVDTGHDEDREPADSLHLGTEADPVDRLTVEPPRPNPARESARLRIRAPQGAHVTATVYDAIGRAVARHDDVGADLRGGDLRLDLAGLASGVYVVRVIATREGLPQTVTRRLTVVR